VTEYITYTGHNNFTTALMANQDFYDGLSEEDQQAIQNAVDVAFAHIIEYQEGLAESELDKILEAKPEMTVTVLTEEQRACFKEAAAEVEQMFVEMTGDSGAAILEQMKADLDATAQ
jgi:TRAP-type C4-dicarboxylate transport system substrate-binding protein